MVKSKGKRSELLKTLEIAIDRRRDGEKGKSKSWVSSIVIFFSVLVGIIAFAWISNKKAKELAKLRHEKNKRAVEKANRAIELKAEKNNIRKAEISQSLDSASREIEKLEDDILRAEKAHKENLEMINSITSWRDI